MTNRPLEYVDAVANLPIADSVAASPSARRATCMNFFVALSVCTLIPIQIPNADHRIIQET